MEKKAKHKTQDLQPAFSNGKKKIKSRCECFTRTSVLWANMVRWPLFWFWQFPGRGTKTVHLHAEYKKKKNQIKSNAIEELLEMKCRKPTVSKLPNGRRVLQLKSEQDFFFPPCVSVFPDFKYTTVTSSKCIVFTCILGWVCVHVHFATWSHLLKRMLNFSPNGGIIQPVCVALIFI